MARQLSSDYGAAYERLIQHVASVGRITPPAASLFWPKVGRAYDVELLLIGRAVNGWIDRWDTDQPADLPGLAAAAQATGQATTDGCPLGWVLDR